MSTILELIQPYKSISIIGMAKNTGKTTTLNRILQEARGNISLGLTSIGRDGEEMDRVTATEKPKIYVQNGTKVATAKNALLGSDFTKEIMHVTDYTTPMGRVVVANALSDGFVDLAGPSIGSQVKEIVHELFCVGCEKVLVDGALGRKSFASPSITEGTILATGAALFENMNKVIEETAYTAELLSLECCDDQKVLEIYKKNPEVKVKIVQRDYSVNRLDVATSMTASNEILRELKEENSFVLIRGVLTDKLLESIIRGKRKVKGLTFIVEDGTKVFVKNDTYLRFLKLGGKIQVEKKINLIAVTMNPTSPYGYEFHSEHFEKKLQEKIKVKVFNVMRG